MAKKTYAELLRDPKWQKLRLKIMERDGFICRSCGDKDSTLNVHHLVMYKKGLNPWDYDYDDLITLCETCHKQITSDTNEIKDIIMRCCFTVSHSQEILQIVKSLDGLNPFQMLAAWQLIQIGVHEELFKLNTLR